MSMLPLFRMSQRNGSGFQKLDHGAPSGFPITICVTLCWRAMRRTPRQHHCPELKRLPPRAGAPVRNIELTASVPPAKGRGPSIFATIQEASIDGPADAYNESTFPNTDWH